jgi:type 1 glutamine amidotransferase
MDTYVKNITTEQITLCDLNNTILPPGQIVNLLSYASKSAIDSSGDLSLIIDKGYAQIGKWRPNTFIITEYHKSPEKTDLENINKITTTYISGYQTTCNKEFPIYVTSSLRLKEDPSIDLEAATKHYVDIQDEATFERVLRLFDGDITIGGNLDVLGILTANNIVTNTITGANGTDGNCRIFIKCNADFDMNNLYNVFDIWTTGKIYFGDTDSYIYQSNNYLGIVSNHDTRIGYEISTNYTQFDSTGHQIMVGTAKPWDDIRIEPSIRSTGANVPVFEKWYDDLAGTSRGVYLYSFDDSATEKEVFFTLQMSHAWDIGSIHMHVHWVGNASLVASTPRWGLEYTWIKPGGTYGDTVIIYTTGNEQGDTNIIANKHYLTEFAPLAPGVTANDVSSILIGRIFRNSSNAADTYTGNKCGLLYIDAHFLLSSLGSTEEYTK